MQGHLAGGVELVELSDDDLEKVAGGKSKRGDSTENQNRYQCNDTKGIGTRVEVELKRIDWAVNL